MKKKKWPDGFPCEVPGNDENPTEAHCDNCNEVFDANEEGILAKAVGNNGAFHKYAFCCYDCACEFSKDNGEMFIDRLNDSSPFNISFRLNPNAPADDPVADAVKTIDLEEPNAEDAAAEPTDEQPALVDNPIVEKKATEAFLEVVSYAKDITQLDSKITSASELLKNLKKERDALVKRQQDLILSRADGFQMTFDDCDKSDDKPAEAEAGQPATDESADAADELPPEPDNSWRSLAPDTQLLVKLTDKQWDAVLSAFPTLGSLQDWLCQDRREKIPGISQTVYDKLVDALNDYVTAYVANKATDAK